MRTPLVETAGNLLGNALECRCGIRIEALRFRGTLSGRPPGRDRHDEEDVADAAADGVFQLPRSSAPAFNGFVSQRGNRLTSLRTRMRVVLADKDLEGLWSSGTLADEDAGA